MHSVKGSALSFDNKSQHDFWSQTSPSLKKFIELCEGLEDWSCSADALQDVYGRVPEEVKALVKTSTADPKADETLDALLGLLSNIEFGPCLQTLIWMDANESGRVGASNSWAVKLYLRAIAKADGKVEEQEAQEAKVFRDRVDLLLDFSLKSELFVRGHVFRHIQESRLNNENNNEHQNTDF